MRIIAGTLGGRVFDAPAGHRTHPMSDKMRGALFNILGDIGGLRVLDAFAGSGAIGFEAASRGAVQVTLLDSDRQSQQTITANIVQLGLADRCRLVRAAAGSWLTTSDTIFDIVILDPPYDDLKPELLQRLAERASATVVLSWPGKLAPPALAGVELRNSKQYGDGSLYIYDRV